MTDHLKPIVLRVHYNTDLSGGAEYDILKLLKVFKDIGVDHRLLIIERRGSSYYFMDHAAPEAGKVVTLSILRTLIPLYIEQHAITVVHLHSLPYAEVVPLFFDTGLPVFKSMHDAMMVCPGWGKFWLTKEVPCTQPFGYHCLWHAYSQSCTRSRRPDRLLDAYRYVRYELQEAVHRYAGIVVYSDYMKAQATAAGIPEDMLHKSPSPQFPSQASAVPVAVHRHDLLFAGRFSPYKGLPYLLRALQVLNGRGIVFHLDVFGDGSNKDALLHLVETLGIQAHVRFHGWVSREVLETHYGTAGMVVVPSIYPDNFPNVVAEAMLREKVVVAFDVGGTTEWFDDGISGFAVKVKDVTALADTIAHVLEQADIVDIGRQAKAKIVAQHSPQHVLDFYTRLYA